MGNHDITYPFKIQIANILQNVFTSNRIYDQLPLDDQDYNFVVYEVKKINNKDSCNKFMIIIDIWGKSEDSVELDQLLDSTVDTFEKKTYNQNNLSSFFHESSSHSIPTNEESTVRRRLTLNADVFKQFN